LLVAEGHAASVEELARHLAGESASTTTPPQPSNENNERKTAMNDPSVPLVPRGGVWSRPALSDGPVRCAAHDLTPDEHDL